MYNNPYNLGSLVARRGLLARPINWGNLLDGTQKTLGVINQAIPIIYQIKPIITNAKTMFQIADTLKSKPAPKTSPKEKTATNNSSFFYIEQKVKN